MGHTEGSRAKPFPVAAGIEQKTLGSLGVSRNRYEQTDCEKRMIISFMHIPMGKRHCAGPLTNDIP